MSGDNDPRDRGARAVLFDDDGMLVVLRRTRPDRAAYLVAPGGGVHVGESWEDAVARECREELGAEIAIGPVAWVVYRPEIVQRFFVARLLSLDPDARTGHEFSEPWRGGYETVRIRVDDPGMAEFRPAELADVLRTHGPFLAAEAAALPR